MIWFFGGLVGVMVPFSIHLGFKWLGVQAVGSSIREVVFTVRGSRFISCFRA